MGASLPSRRFLTCVRAWRGPAHIRAPPYRFVSRVGSLLSRPWLQCAAPTAPVPWDATGTSGAAPSYPAAISTARAPTPPPTGATGGARAPRSVPPPRPPRRRTTVSLGAASPGSFRNPVPPNPRHQRISSFVLHSCVEVASQGGSPADLSLSPSHACRIKFGVFSARQDSLKPNTKEL